VDISTLHSLAPPIISLRFKSNTEISMIIKVHYCRIESLFRLRVISCYFGYFIVENWLHYVGVFSEEEEDKECEVK